MAIFFRSIHLSIRQKIVLGFVLSIIGVLIIGVVAYRNLLRIEQKLKFVVIGHELHDDLLEVRRYEKNYLLYNGRHNYDQAVFNLDEAKTVFLVLQSDFRGLEGAAYLAELQNAIEIYGESLKELLLISERKNATRLQMAEVEKQLRVTGKDLVNLSLKLAEFEHTRIQEIIQVLKRDLGSLSMIFVVLGVFLTILVTQKIVKPLRVIERTTDRIAQGDFKPLPVIQTDDETQSVVEAFNKMIFELEKRQKQLLQAQKLSSLGILTSGIAHQLNNPLNNISTSCQILLEEIHDGDSEQINRLLSNIDQEVDRSRDIVKGLLDFSREREFQLNWVNLENLVLRTIQLVSSQLPPGVEISSNIPEDLDIYLDVQKFQEVLLNLVLNAIQAMPGGTGSINIDARKNKENIQIHVRDSGCGILSEHLPYIFDPFFSTKEVGYGTGLGLSVAYGIIEQHGGTITVKSKAGEGTGFTINLPLGTEPYPGEGGV
ncbi:ATP-binding protein [Thermodesulfobacteriota bacterium]